MSNSKPAIRIYAHHADLAILDEICAGIEEEGVLYEVYQKEISDIDALAYEAANDSILGSGIGVVNQTAALQMRSVPRGKNIFSCKNEQKSRYRNLGINSAKVVKRRPFIELASEH